MIWRTYSLPVREKSLASTLSPISTAQSSGLARARMLSRALVLRRVFDAEIAGFVDEIVLKEETEIVAV
jgi:hypothetical protein